MLSANFKKFFSGKITAAGNQALNRKQKKFGIAKR